MISGSPDELFDQIPELGYLYTGELLAAVSKEFKEVTGMDFDAGT
jgi:hypothetical protein